MWLSIFATKISAPSWPVDEATSAMSPVFSSTNENEQSRMARMGPVSVHCLSRILLNRKAVLKKGRCSNFFFLGYSTEDYSFSALLNFRVLALGTSLSHVIYNFPLFFEARKISSRKLSDEIVTVEVWIPSPAPWAERGSLRKLDYMFPRIWWERVRAVYGASAGDMAMAGAIFCSSKVAMGSSRGPPLSAAMAYCVVHWTLKL